MDYNPTFATTLTIVALACVAFVPTEVVAKSIFKDPRGWARDVGRSAETDLNNLGQRVERDLRNTGRWIREDNCDRIRRKEGEVAYRRCLAPKPRATPVSYPQQMGGRGYAIMEVGCVYQVSGVRYGSTTLTHHVQGSREQAIAHLERHYRENNVCNQRFGRSDLRDLPYRWVHH